MITTSQEDYLKVIYDENLKRNKINNKFIANKLGISAPSVSAMIKKLKEEQMITDSILYGLELTDFGKEKTRHLLSKHRLWELFLINYLDYTWDEVHQDADLLEHVTGDKLLQKLNLFLGKPKKCPHGKTIYLNTNEIKNSFGKKLSDCKPGFIGYINIIEDNVDLLQYLTDLNIKIDTKIKILKKNKFDESYLLNIGGNNITISSKAAKKIYIRL